MSDLDFAPRLRNNIVTAIRANLVPGLFLQALALLIAWSYFSLPEARPAFNALAALKEASGPVYALIATSVFGGLVPYLFLLQRGRIVKDRVAQGVFYVAIWAFMGLLVDALYAQQAQWFGSEGDIMTVAKKVAVDQLGFSAFISSPILTTAYLWKDKGFDGRATRAAITREFFLLHIPTTVAANWVVWTPAVCVIYALPSALQVPLFNLVLCFFVLLLSMLKRS